MELIWTENLRVFPSRVIKDRRKRDAFPDEGREIGEDG